MDAKHYNTKENYDKIKRWNEGRDRGTDVEISIDERELKRKLDTAIKRVLNNLNK